MDEPINETHKNKSMKHRLVFTWCVVTLLASTAHASQEQLAASIQEARAEAARASEQLKTTLGALTTLTTQTKGDLRPAFDAFSAEVPKTEAAAAWTRARTTWMAGDGQRYFENWQQTIDAISNESLRKNAQKRLTVVKKSYAKVEASLKSAGEKFQPFLSDLTDIQKLLSQDVTAGGIKAVRDTVRDANWRYKKVNATFNDALKEMDRMEKSLSTETK